LTGNTSIERALQLIKGGYSFRRGKELGLTGEIWPPGFSEVRVMGRKSYLAHKKYIDENPAQEEKGQRLKPGIFRASFRPG
jgi:putative transposase